MTLFEELMHFVNLCHGKAVSLNTIIEEMDLNILFNCVFHSLRTQTPFYPIKLIKLYHVTGDLNRIRAYCVHNTIITSLILKLTVNCEYTFKHLLFNHRVHVTLANTWKFQLFVDNQPSWFRINSNSKRINTFIPCKSDNLLVNIYCFSYLDLGHHAFLKINTWPPNELFFHLNFIQYSIS
jgi:hypothetical protein